MKVFKLCYRSDANFNHLYARIFSFFVAQLIKKLTKVSVNA